MPATAGTYMLFYVSLYNFLLFFLGCISGISSSWLICVSVSVCVEMQLLRAQYALQTGTCINKYLIKMNVI